MEWVVIMVLIMNFVIIFVGIHTIISNQGFIIKKINELKQNINELNK